MATLIADSASQPHVQAKVDLAVNGDVVLIPSGSSTWTSGITTTKRIIICAQNYTATKWPTTSTVRNVTITYTGTTGHAFDMTSGNDFHCAVGGIKFMPPTLLFQGNVASGIWGYVRFQGSGTKPPLLFDCHMVANERQNVTAGEASFLSIDSLGAVVWNTCFDGTQVAPGGAGGGGDGVSGVGIHVSSSRGYLTASTMGMLDTGGLTNVYVEDCVMDWWGQSDVDNNGRVVIRYNTQYGCSWQTHGYTSFNGGRHVEQYNCILNNQKSGRNHTRWFWLRAGTCLFADNEVDGNTSGFGAAPIGLLTIGDNAAPFTAYPANRAVNGPANPGWGHDGSQFRSDPIYLWNNHDRVGSVANGKINTYVVNDVGPPVNDWTAHCVAGRDLFTTGDGLGGSSAPVAKPSTLGSPGAYAKYTYPHPLRVAITGGGGGNGGGGGGTGVITTTSLVDQYRRHYGGPRG